MECTGLRLRAGSPAAGGVLNPTDETSLAWLRLADRGGPGACGRSGTSGRYLPRRPRKAGQGQRDGPGRARLLRETWDKLELRRSSSLRAFVFCMTVNGQSRKEIPQDAHIDSRSAALEGSRRATLSRLDRKKLGIGKGRQGREHHGTDSDSAGMPQLELPGMSGRRRGVMTSARLLHSSDIARFSPFLTHVPSPQPLDSIRSNCSLEYSVTKSV